MEKNFLYTPEELADIEGARDIKELQDIARRFIYDIKKQGDVRMLCAPLDVDNGIKEEERFYCLSICEGRQKLLNYKVFSYIAFLRRAVAILGCSTAEALQVMQHPFFYGFIHTGWIAEYYFMPSWQNSPFCQWIMGQARHRRHNRKIIMWLDE